MTQISQGFIEDSPYHCYYVIDFSTFKRLIRNNHWKINVNLRKKLLLFATKLGDNLNTG